MTKQEFINALLAELEKNHVPKAQEILDDYEEHFSHALSKGKTESAICEGLGNPISIARAYETEKLIKEIKSPEKPFQWGLAFTVIGRLLVLAPFNFFVLLIPGVVIGALITAGWSVAVAIGTTSIAILTSLPKMAAVAVSGWAWMAGISTSLGLMGVGVLGLLCMFFITKFILLGLISYLQWNLKFILER